MKRNWLWIGLGVLVLAFVAGGAGGQLPFVLLLLLCPLLHLLGAHGHGGHGSGAERRADPGAAGPDGGQDAGRSR